MYPYESDRTSTDIINFIYSKRRYSLEKKIRNCDSKCRIYARRIARARVMKLNEQKIAIKKNKVIIKYFNIRNINFDAMI